MTVDRPKKKRLFSSDLDDDLHLRKAKEVLMVEAEEEVAVHLWF